MRKFVLLDTPAGSYTTADVRARDRVVAWLRSNSLDRRLAAGEEPETERALAVRAAAITSPSSRRRLARDTLALVGRAEQAPRAGRPKAGRNVDMRVPLARKRIRGARSLLADLATVIGEPTPVPVRAVVAARRLLSDPASPVWADARRTDLAGEVGEILDALRTPHPSPR